MESTDSSSASARHHQQQQEHPQLPPGFRFHPTDEELVVHYLKKKAASDPLPVAIIAEVDLYKFDPWELPGKANFGDQEWYFFSPRDRKYPNGARPNRAATSGYWKATGTDKPIMASAGPQKVGVKKALVFYGGKPPKGIKTNWIMHEYRLADSTPKRLPGTAGLPKGGSLRLDDWVLCRIYKKNTSLSSSSNSNGSQILRSVDSEDSVERMLAAAPPAANNPRASAAGNYGTYNALLDNEDTFVEDFLTGDGQYSMTQLGRTKSSDPNMASKRALAAPFWSDTGGIPLPPPAKRFSAGGSTSSVRNNNNNSSSSNSSTNNNSTNVTTSQSIAMLLNQIPPDYQQQASILGSLGVDGSSTIFRQPFQLSGINWAG